MNAPTLKTIEDRVKSLVGTQFGVAPEQIDLAANLEKEYDGDSLDVVELTMAVEDEFGIEVSDSDMFKFTTGQAIADYVREQK